MPAVEEVPVVNWEHELDRFAICWHCANFKPSLFDSFCVRLNRDVRASESCECFRSADSKIQERLREIVENLSS